MKTKISEFDRACLLLHIAIAKQQDFHDTTMLMCGIEGSGKSTLCLDFYQEFCRVKDISETMLNVSFSLKGFIHTLYNSNKKDFLFLDEGGELQSDRQLEGISKALRSAYTVMRKKSLITLICFTNPLRVNTYFKEDRVKGMTAELIENFIC